MRGQPGAARPGAGDCGCWVPSAGWCSHGISDSAHRRCNVCHGDRLAGVFLVPGSGRLGGRPGPPGRPRRARVGPTTGSAARKERRERPVPAAVGPFLSGEKGAWGGGNAGSDAAVAATGSPGSSLAAASGLGSSTSSCQEMGDSPGSGSGSGERRNQPAGGATPGQSLPFAGSPTGGVTSGRGCTAWRAIRPGGTDQDRTILSVQPRPEVPARCGSSAEPGS
jgi:hypothetical protein